MQVVSESKKQIAACNIEGECDDCVNLLVNKNKEKLLSGEQGECLSGRLIILDSHDGAEHRKTTSKKFSIVSFSSQLISKSSVSLGMSPASSQNILTWQQMLGNETAANLFPVLQPIHERKKAMLQTSTPDCLKKCDFVCVIFIMAKCCACSLLIHCTTGSITLSCFASAKEVKDALMRTMSAKSFLMTIKSITGTGPRRAPSKEQVSSNKGSHSKKKQVVWIDEINLEFHILARIQIC